MASINAVAPPPLAYQGEGTPDVDRLNSALNTVRSFTNRPRKRRGVIPQGSPTGPLEPGLELCKFFQSGCCWYDDACFFRHAPAKEDSGFKSILCHNFVNLGQCALENCSGAHGNAELRTPKVFEGNDGYKASLCLWHMVEDLECDQASHNCFDAHGVLDLRRVPLTMPPELEGCQFTYSDAHVHLDHVLLSRRFGTKFTYKRALCTRRPCENPWCLWAHGESDRRPRLPIEHADFLALAAELRQAVTGGTFGGCVHSCCEAEAIEDAVRLVQWGREALDGRVYVSFGVHPTSYETYTPELEARLEAALAACGSQAVAWGECGLDYYLQKTESADFGPRREQMLDVFIRQVRLAVRKNLPLVVHSRDAEEDTLKVLRDILPLDHHVYLHSFTASAVDILSEFLERWPHSCVGIAGAVTYQNARNLHALARVLPLDRMLLETDGPYMAPEPCRYHHTAPGHVPCIAAGIARLKGVSAVEVLAACHENFLRFYRLKCT